jgi:hypothetical protein
MKAGRPIVQAIGRMPGGLFHVLSSEVTASIADTAIKYCKEDRAPERNGVPI